jgi:hypothetical protein
MSKSGREPPKGSVGPGLQDHRHSFRPAPDASRILPEANKPSPLAIHSFSIFIPECRAFVSGICLNISRDALGSCGLLFKPSRCQYVTRVYEHQIIYAAPVCRSQMISIATCLARAVELV